MIISYTTDVGRIRKENQDSVYAKQIDDNAALLIVADGMGGHKGGRTASRSAIEQIVIKILGGYRENLTDEEICDLLRIAVFEANGNIYSASLKDFELVGMGTTAVVAIITGGTLYTANVGDSRLYHFSKGELKQITTDHSYVESLVSKGIISKDEARNHPKKNVITRAVGSESMVDIDIFRTDVSKGDKILLCSDGLSGCVSEEIIHTVVSDGGTLREKAEGLVELANAAGGPDNITVLIVEL